MSDNPFTALSRVMHEPNRLAIISALAAAVDGLSFSDLKAECNLTDGNLNRHLKALEEEKIIAQQKDAPEGKRPRTTITLTPAGRKRFVKYLATSGRSPRPGGGFGRLARPGGIHFKPSPKSGVIELVGATGLEPVTSSMSRMRSSQLSYAPKGRKGE